MTEIDTPGDTADKTIAALETLFGAASPASVFSEPEVHGEDLVFCEALRTQTSRVPC